MRSIAMETRSWLEPAVELRLGKICRRLPQDLVRLAQLTVLTLERLDPLALFCCRTRPKTLVTFGLPHPVAQCLARAADLLGNRVDRRRYRQLVWLRSKRYARPGLGVLRLCQSGRTGDLRPGLKGLGPGSSILIGGDVIAVEVEQIVDPVMGGEEALRLAG